MIRHLALCTLLLAGLGSLTAEDKTPAPAEAAKVERLKTDQWCWTHDLPKDKCAACDKKLIPALKKAKDWCAECGVAESLCLKCDPKVKEVLDALRPLDKPKAVK